MENASRIYTYEKVKQMVERQKKRFGWEFLFLGANIDAIAEAGRFGIKADRAVNYNCDSVGTEVNFKAISKAVSKVRACAETCRLDEALMDWDEDITKDYQQRKR